MNIWDSVQRGLEKATNEAGRIARIQRLRSTIDNLSRQAFAQQNNLITRALEVYNAGNLTQSELLPICQELVSLQQQLEQAQKEMKALLGSGSQSGPTTPSMTPPAAGDMAATVFAPPPPGFEQIPAPNVTGPVPPPAGAFTSTQTGPIPGQPSAYDPTRYCPHCHAERVPGHDYCYNCGQLVRDHEISHLPTARSDTPAMPSTPALADQSTIFSPEPPVVDQDTRHEPLSSTRPHADSVQESDETGKANTEVGGP